MATVVRLPLRGITTRPLDGTTGVLVRVHWTQWVPYFLFAPIIAAGAFLAVQEAFLYGSWAGYLALAAAILLIGKVLFLWALDLYDRRILVTKLTVYDMRRQFLFFTTTAAIPLTDNGRFDHRVNGVIGEDGSIKDGSWNSFSTILGVRSFGYINEGDDPECFLPASDITQDDIHKINILRALST